MLTNQWWIEPALPVTLAIIIFLALTYILVVGTKRDRLSSAVESLFIKSAVDFSSDQIYQKVNRVLAISATAGDLDVLKTSKEGFLPDIHLDEYARVIEKVAKLQPERIYFSWLPASHSPSVKHLQPLIEIIRRYQNIPIFVGYPVEEISNLEPEILKKMQFLEADDCGRDVQTVCSYNRNWSKWIIQHIANWAKPDDFDNEDVGYVSLNLPHYRPNYIMNLPAKSRITQRTFTEILQENDLPEDLKGVSVFIGPSFTATTPGADDKSVIRRTYTSLDDTGVVIGQGGTPFHVFWAQIAHMFLEKRLVRVAPQWVSLALCTLFCSLIIILILKYGAALALGTFMLISIGMPMINLLGMRYFFVYIPVFEVIYSGMMVFLFASMGFLSFQTYQRWRLDQLAKTHGETANLRSNFISVTSHNLNTPIAQIQGLLGILKQSKNLEGSSDLVLKIFEDISLMQLFVRSVLIQSALDDGVSPKVSLSFNKFEDEFEQLVGATLKKLGAGMTFRLQSEEPEDLALPFQIDIRSLSHCLGNIRILQYLDGGAPNAETIVTLDMEGENVTFEFPVASEIQAKDLLNKVQKSREDSGESSDEGNMLNDVFAKFINTYLVKNDASFSKEEVVS